MKKVELLRALDLAKEGKWDQSHLLVQDGVDRYAAWIHAHLHRVEGDLSNASYWYDRAGRPDCKGSLDSEWQELRAIILDLEK